MDNGFDFIQALAFLAGLILTIILMGYSLEIDARNKWVKDARIKRKLRKIFKQFKIQDLEL
jgi:hypothetical protein